VAHPHPPHRPSPLLPQLYVGLEEKGFRGRKADQMVRMMIGQFRGSEDDGGD